MEVIIIISYTLKMTSSPKETCENRKGKERGTKKNERS